MEGLYTSNNAGSTWNLNVASTGWISVSMSEDGSKQIAAGQYDQIYTSNDLGNSWYVDASTSSQIWSSVTISLDGTCQTAAVTNGYIYCLS